MIGSIGRSTVMKSDRDPTDDPVRRFEDALCELLDEGHSILNFDDLLQAAAERAGVDLQDIDPTSH